MISPSTSQRLVDIDEHTFLERVPISEMFVAPYGRPVGATQIARMLKSGFDPRKLGILTLSLRSDGRYAILDGNHRRTVATHAGLLTLLARVFIDLSYEEEARLFTALNTVNAPSAVDRWRARREFGDPTVVTVESILANRGLKINLTSMEASPGRLTCVAALEKCFKERGAIELGEILDILIAAWGDDPAAFTGRMLDGLRMFWARYRGVARLDRLVPQLQATTPHRLHAAAVGKVISHDPAAVSLGKQIAATYVGRSTKYTLPDWSPQIKNREQYQPHHATAARMVAKAAE